MSAIEKAAKRLFAARLVSSQAKFCLQQYRQEHGGCIYPPESGRSNCYLQWQLPKARWCEVCRGSEPIYQARKKAAIEVATAMRALMHLCKKLFQDKTV